MRLYCKDLWPGPQKVNERPHSRRKCESDDRDELIMAIMEAMHCQGPTSEASHLEDNEECILRSSFAEEAAAIVPLIQQQNPTKTITRMGVNACTRTSRNENLKPFLNFESTCAMDDSENLPALEHTHTVDDMLSTSSERVSNRDPMPTESSLVRNEIGFHGLPICRQTRNVDDVDGIMNNILVDLNSSCLSSPTKTSPPPGTYKGTFRPPICRESFTQLAEKQQKAYEIESFITRSRGIQDEFTNKDKRNSITQKIARSYSDVTIESEALSRSIRFEETEILRRRSDSNIVVDSFSVSNCFRDPVITSIRSNKFLSCFSDTILDDDDAALACEIQEEMVVEYALAQSSVRENRHRKDVTYISPLSPDMFAEKAFSINELISCCNNICNVDDEAIARAIQDNDVLAATIAEEQVMLDAALAEAMQFSISRLENYERELHEKQDLAFALRLSEHEYVQGGYDSVLRQEDERDCQGLSVRRLLKLTNELLVTAYSDFPPSLLIQDENQPEKLDENSKNPLSRATLTFEPKMLKRNALSIRQVAKKLSSIRRTNPTRQKQKQL